MYSFPTATWRISLLGGQGRIWKRPELAAHAGKQGAEAIAERCGSNGYSERNKDEKHRIFGGGGATCVAAKASD
jgi:hypothetical protein